MQARAFVEDPTCVINSYALKIASDGTDDTLLRLHAQRRGYSEPTPATYHAEHDHTRGDNNRSDEPRIPLGSHRREKGDP